MRYTFKFSRLVFPVSIILLISCLLLYVTKKRIFPLMSQATKVMDVDLERYPSLAWISDTKFIAIAFDKNIERNFVIVDTTLKTVTPLIGLNRILKSLIKSNSSANISDFDTSVSPDCKSLMVGDFYILKAMLRLQGKHQIVGK